MADDPPHVSGVRPYLITRGRARAVDAKLQVEAQVLATREGRAALERLSYEHRDIVALSMRPTAIAEIAAQLGLHLGVTRVVVADLVALGYLVVRQRERVGGPQQVHIIERVIRGLTSIG